MTTSYLGTKLALACASFLAFAGLTAFVGAREREAGIQAGAPPVAASGVVAADDQGASISVPADQQTPTPVARTRGT